VERNKARHLKETLEQNHLALREKENKNDSKETSRSSN
jgi:hypothetical protein